MKNHRLSGALFLVAALGCGTTHAETAWSQFQGNAQHTGYTDVKLTTPLSLAWTKDFGLAVNPVAAADGSVFVTTQGWFSGQKLFTLNAATGSERWSKDFGDIASVNPPSYDRGRVYLQTGNHASDSYFRGYDAASGELKIKTPFAAQWERYQAPTIYRGNAYVNGGYYGGAYSFSLGSGNERWFTELEQYDGWTPAVNDKYVVTYTEDKLRALDPKTGVVMKTIVDPNFSWAGYGSATPVLVGDHAFVAASGYLTNFNLDTGKIDWALAGVSGQIAVDQNEIFAVRNGTLSSVDAITGKVNWMWEEDSDSSYSFEILATRNLVFISGSSNTYVVDRNTHQTVQVLSEAGHFALGNDQFYIATATGLSAYAVTAVPEVGTLSLFGLGLGAVALARRRRQPQRHADDTLCA